MIGFLILASSFMILILIAVLMLAFNLRHWAYKKEQESQRRFDELTKRIDETQGLFKNEVGELLDNFKKLLK